ncbi:hypothetical protein [Variovorax sp. JS1663]|uniref:hypothetical protein n=1 Tax=Variovorax sp. JS1663 TaxID=1851577 RepID=UPI000B3446B7|nr:hypothetical protein [Variovorax sp. JS1663]OUM00791.1 hypothetical protein A8M77_19040 [Variovorax sp. JS1663]
MMDPDELSLVEDILRSQVGRSARMRPYDRTLNSPMNFVLERAEKQLGAAFTVYWVENAAPEVFCLEGFSEPVAVFSTRYIELWADFRGLLTSKTFAPDLLEGLFEQLSLRLIAELSLAKDDPDFAASAFIKSLMVKRGITKLANSVLSLEAEPLSSAYMACWFYGLCHELGHIKAHDKDLVRQTFGDDFIRDKVGTILDEVFDSPALREEALELARAKPDSFILGADVLRSEGMADIFATSVLFASTVEIMHRPSEASPAGEERLDFDLLSFVWEMGLSLGIIGLHDRCRRISQVACTPSPTHRDKLDVLLHLVAVNTRLLMVRWYLQMAGSHYAFGESATALEQEKLSAAIDSVMEHLEASFRTAERGLNRAFEFSIDRLRRPVFFQLAGEWRQALIESGREIALEVVEVKQFCERARSLGRWSDAFDVMESVVSNPAKPMQMTFSSGEVRGFSCPWVEAPDGTNHPFGLDTAHGHLIFVFEMGGNEEVEKIYSEVSASLLPAGHQLTSVVIAAKTLDQVRDAIALRLPLNEQFEVVIEGTPQFDLYISQLADGSIWSIGTSRLT